MLWDYSFVLWVLGMICLYRRRCGTFGCIMGVVELCVCIVGVIGLFVSIVGGVGLFACISCVLGL